MDGHENRFRIPARIGPDVKTGVEEEACHAQHSRLCRLRIGQARGLAAVRHRYGGISGRRARQLAACVPDGRPQAARRDRPRHGRRRPLLRLGGCRPDRAGCARRPVGKGGHKSYGRTADAGGCAPRSCADLVSRPGRQPAGSLLRRRDRRHAVQAGTLDFGIPHGCARPRSCRADGREHRTRDGILCRGARLPPLRLYRKAFSRLFLPPQSAPSQPRADRDRQRRHASSDGGIVLARRCRPSLRHRAQRRSRQCHARPSHQRFHDVVLRKNAVVVHGGVRMGRTRDRSFDLAAGRDDAWPESMGA